jgi:hypothetical protein
VDTAIYIDVDCRDKPACHMQEEQDFLQRLFSRLYFRYLQLSFSGFRVKILYGAGGIVSCHGGSEEAKMAGSYTYGIAHHIGCNAGGVFFAA